MYIKKNTCWVKVTSCGNWILTTTYEITIATSITGWTWYTISGSNWPIAKNIYFMKNKIWNLNAIELKFLIYYKLPGDLSFSHWHVPITLLQVNERAFILKKFDRNLFYFDYYREKAIIHQNSRVDGKHCVPSAQYWSCEARGTWKLLIFTSS